MDSSSQLPDEPSGFSDSVSYGIEGTLPTPPVGCFDSATAAQRFGVTVDQIEEYARAGLLISLKSSSGDSYYTDRDGEWCSTLRRLHEEAQVSSDGIRTLLVARCTCWKFRHCEFHAKSDCPVTSDLSQPCWVNRARWSILVSQPCYSCIVYRSAPKCEALREVLDVRPTGQPETDSRCGG